MVNDYIFLWDQYMDHHMRQAYKNRSGNCWIGGRCYTNLEVFQTWRAWKRKEKIERIYSNGI